MPRNIVAEAENLMPKADREIESLLADLESRDAKLAKLESEIEATSAELKRRHSELAGRESDFGTRDEALQLRESEIESEGREKARRFMLDARNRVEEALALARLPEEEADPKRARQIVEEGLQVGVYTERLITVPGWLQVLGPALLGDTEAGAQAFVEAAERAGHHA